MQISNFGAVVRKGSGGGMGRKRGGKVSFPPSFCSENHQEGLYRKCVLNIAYCVLLVCICLCPCHGPGPGPGPRELGVRPGFTFTALITLSKHQSRTIIVYIQKNTSVCLRLQVSTACTRACLMNTARRVQLICMVEQLRGV